MILIMPSKTLEASGELNQTVSYKAQAISVTEQLTPLQCPSKRKNIPFTEDKSYLLQSLPQCSFTQNFQLNAIARNTKQ